MTEPTQPTTYPPPCQPQPGTAHWPIGGSIIRCGVAILDERGDSIIPLSVTVNLSAGVELYQDATVSLLYIVNGSLDYSGLFSQIEVGRYATTTFKAGETETSFTILTLPIPSGSTFELEIVAYAASAGTIISTPPASGDSVSATVANEKSLKALNTLSTTALVTALGALAFALLRYKD